MKNKENEKIKIKLSTFLVIAIIITILVIIIIGGICFYINSNKLENNSNSVDNTENVDNSIEEDKQSDRNEDETVKEEINDPISSEVFSIKDKTLYWKEITGGSNDGMRLLEYNNTEKDYAEIYYILYDYSTDPSIKYTLEITDDSNNNIIKDNSESIIIGGMVSTIKIKKMNSDSIINFTMYEKDYDTEKIFQKSQIQINLKNDLEEKVKINQEDLIDGKLGDISFKYIDEEYVYFGNTSHGYSQNLVGENSSFPINVQYGNYLIPQEHIEFSYDKNVNNLDLEDAFQSYVSITENMGQYGLSDIYGLSVLDENGELTEDIIIVSFEEMMNLVNNKTIEKNGKAYTVDSFKMYSGLKFIKNENVKIGNNIDAIKYNLENNDEAESYMFIYGDNIYNIKVPTNERISDEVQQFIDSLQINR